MRNEDNFQYIEIFTRNRAARKHSLFLNQLPKFQWFFRSPSMYTKYYRSIGGRVILTVVICIYILSHCPFSWSFSITRVYTQNNLQVCDGTAVAAFGLTPPVGLKLRYCTSCNGSFPGPQNCTDFKFRRTSVLKIVIVPGQL